MDSDKPSGIISILKSIFIQGKNPLTNNYEINKLRPPGAIEEPQFMALCIRCNRCLEVCPYSSIIRDGIGPTIGTPYVMAEEKACYLCMACCRLCPTGALNRDLKDPEKVKMGKAGIDPEICYSHIFLKQDKIPEFSTQKIGALCNTCYNVCPFPEKAIKLKNNLFPVVLDGCVGCGVCVERCPTRPKRAINIVPSGMGKRDDAGFYFRKAKQRYQSDGQSPVEPSHKGPLKGDLLLEKKQRIEGATDKPVFDFPYDVPDTIEEWE